MDASFFAGFSQDLHKETLWKGFYAARHPEERTIPPLPQIDAERLFHAMMDGARTPDPWMFPALRRLRESGRHVLAALSNTVIYPPGHEQKSTSHWLQDDSMRRLFDVFVSSAHVGVRKPEPEAYRLALDMVNEFLRSQAELQRVRDFPWEGPVVPTDVLFLDDIGENLREARRQGFHTIKVNLGETYTAVRELERITGLRLISHSLSPKDTVSSHERKAKM